MATGQGDEFKPTLEDLFAVRGHLLREIERLQNQLADINKTIDDLRK